MKSIYSKFCSNIGLVWREPSPKNTLGLFFGLLFIAQVLARCMDFLDLSVVSSLNGRSVSVEHLLEVLDVMSLRIAPHFVGLAFLTGLVCIFDFYRRTKKDKEGTKPGIVAYLGLGVSAYLYFVFLLYVDVIAPSDASFLQLSELYSAIAVAVLGLLPTTNYILHTVLLTDEHPLNTVSLNVLLFIGAPYLLLFLTDSSVTNHVLYLIANAFSIFIYIRLLMPHKKCD